MNSYIDETTKEQFTEDITIREAINSIYDMLAELPKEKRLAFFEQISKPKDLDFVKEIDGIYYVACAHFDREQKEDMITKVNRVLGAEV
ncbi:hypothetical protein D1841_16295 [Neglecta sp. X4]|uniref:hypothetical protein n=1 Tax=unclassified Neglectibacter TaxID=2632164 RepID=UPI00136A9D4B|nr:MULTISPECIES: hypothetical protein [unclassified Neglectibacter]NBI19073.1 hypothetical protein [Neglectibacter sp. 59]NBJ74729.1 hypothetical protein [Neglectibacter sp. X4]NCE82541.1 hypothetical protein [Neglectibacter sp. X58]